ncbi:unannotated protein [freshwater metagenome]|uniref:Unannotated protein n=1 Tax=freshwater metagenome TaxID=449393 RepID=A0A6J6KB70_9ZZZZ
MAPNTALDQDALRNSSFVANKSFALDAILCSSIKTISVPAGTLDNNVSVLSTSKGMSDSIPSKIIPSLILSNISSAPGYLLLAFKALFFTSSVSRSSRQAKIEILSSTDLIVRWSETSK